jgi:lipopolysaccharide transport system permease protein
VVVKLYAHSYLFRQLIRRDIQAKHKGTLGGGVWLVAQPLLMLAIYTLVFGLVFQPKWSGAGSIWDFSLILFLGKIPYIYILETLGRAPSLMASNANYVKRTQFPLGLLVLMSHATALFVVMVSFLVWFIFFVAIKADLPSPTSLLLPLIYLPMCLAATGLSYFLSSLGAYFKDVGQVVQPVLFSMMFLSPVFYPISVSPGWMRTFLRINPMSQAIEQSRSVMYFAQEMDWAWWAAHMAGGLIVLALGYLWFRKTRGGFAEVL